MGSKLAKAKIECSLEMGKQTPVLVPIILLLIMHKYSFPLI